MKFLLVAVFIAQVLLSHGDDCPCHSVGADDVFCDPECTGGNPPIGCNAGGQGQQCRFCFAAPGTCSGVVTGTGAGGTTTPGVVPHGDHKIEFINNCPNTVWVGALGAAGWPIPLSGGWQLVSGQSNQITLPQGWSGRFWGRTGCVNGQCATGDCGGKIECNGAGGNPPATLAEFTFNGAGGLDFYDVSLVDGYNTPMAIEPVEGTYQRLNESDKYDCRKAGCSSDLNTICPPELSVLSGGQTVACQSACEKFNTDEYCCRGAFGTPQTCKSSLWPVNYPAIFKQACPDAYSYAYDDFTSTFVCLGHPASAYVISFCP